MLLMPEIGSCNDDEFERLGTLVAWECLRRNPYYCRDYYRVCNEVNRFTCLRTGAYYLHARRRHMLAKKWGLLFLANPALSAEQAHVFWDPDIYPAALRIMFTHKQYRCVFKPKGETINLSHLNVPRKIYLDVENTRHILMCSDQYWIQLYCKNCPLIGEDADINFYMQSFLDTLMRRIDTAKQLVSLSQSGGEGLALKGRARKYRQLHDALIAYDIHMAGGSYRDIATAFVGNMRVGSDWISAGCYLKDRARRSLKRGKLYVGGKYKVLLTRKSI